MRWRIAVGSARRPKAGAVREAACTIAGVIRREGAIGANRGTEVAMEVIGYEVESGVGHTPVSREKLARGARQKAEALQAKLGAEGAVADFFVGLEGGLDVIADNGWKQVFLQSWAYVSDGERGHYGCSGSIELPEALAEEVLIRGTERGLAIDQYAGAVGIRDGEGAWGILSGASSRARNRFDLR